MLLTILSIARSARDDVNLKDAIGKHESAASDLNMIAPSGNIRLTKDKHQLMSLLEQVATCSQCAVLSEPRFDYLVIEAIAVVHEVLTTDDNIKTCNDLADAFVRVTDSKCSKYQQ